MLAHAQLSHVYLASTLNVTHVIKCPRLFQESLGTRLTIYYNDVDIENYSFASQFNFCRLSAFSLITSISIFPSKHSNLSFFNMKQEF